MNFKKDVLLKHIDAAIDAERTAHEQKYKDELEEHEAERARWTVDHAGRWNAFLTRAAQVRRAGGPITVDMLPNTNTNRSVPHYICELGVLDTPPAAPGPFKPSRELMALRKLIEASVDEVINTKTIGAKRILEILE